MSEGMVRGVAYCLSLSDHALGAWWEVWPTACHWVLVH